LNPWKSQVGQPFTGEKEREMKANSWGILVNEHQGEINKRIKDGLKRD
jgi:hypothetical protein